MEKPSHLFHKNIMARMQACRTSRYCNYNVLISFTLLGFIATTTLSIPHRNAHSYSCHQGKKKSCRYEDYQYKAKYSFRCPHGTNIKIDYAIPVIIAIIFTIKNINYKTKVVLLLQLKPRSS